MLFGGFVLRVVVLLGSAQCTWPAHTGISVRRSAPAFLFAAAMCQPTESNRVRGQLLEEVVRENPAPAEFEAWLMAL